MSTSRTFGALLTCFLIAASLSILFCSAQISRVRDARALILRAAKEGHVSGLEFACGNMNSAALCSELTLHETTGPLRDNDVRILINRLYLSRDLASAATAAKIDFIIDQLEGNAGSSGVSELIGESDMPPRHRIYGALIAQAALCHEKLKTDCQIGLPRELGVSLMQATKNVANDPNTEDDAREAARRLLASGAVPNY